MLERDIMGGLAKGLLAIETFRADTPRQSISEVAAASGLDRATARRCLLTLAHLGYATYDGKYFTLTPRVLRLGTACLATMPMPSIIQPMLDDLSERIGESSSASILDGSEIVYVARAAQRKIMSISLMAGSRLPAHCTSMGRAMLAQLKDPDLTALIGEGPFEPRTKNTIATLEGLQAEFAKIREQGYALNDQETEIGLRSIAVPVYNSRKVVIAAINIGVSAFHYENTEVVAKFFPQLVEIQNELRGLIH
ncbi:helix-turn-helix domain-containing protein [Devosia sp. WQ 349]|uniref:IclR family transcriptional regulator domain-containing protein n=1 Tax=Devosia sp. WQ 349K1 TaxID=2800329 RepID=UPI001907C198|nr:helix-turn-helix domain-containing protein [Devosia sp. WQ 349K1]